MSISDALRVLEESHRESVLVVDKQRHLLGTATDSDIRRALLRERATDCPLDQIMPRSPLTGNGKMSRVDLICYMGAAMCCNCR